MLKNIFNKVFSNQRKESDLCRKISYSQCGEDLIIQFIFDAIKVEEFSYVDIGANDPLYINNTYLFYKSGHHGINIEPNADHISNFNKYRPLDRNLCIGIGNSEDHMDYYMFENSALNTFDVGSLQINVSEGHALKRKLKIKVESIENVLNKYEPKLPYLLSIDTEGADERILRSIDYNIHRPTVICAETLSFSNNGLGNKSDKIIRYLLNKGYMLYADTHINSIFVDCNKWVRK